VEKGERIFKKGEELRNPSWPQTPFVSTPRFPAKEMPNPPLCETHLKKKGKNWEPKRKNNFNARKLPNTTKAGPLKLKEELKEEKKKQARMKGRKKNIQKEKQKEEKWVGLGDFRGKTPVLRSPW